MDGLRSVRIRTCKTCGDVHAFQNFIASARKRGAPRTVNGERVARQGQCRTRRSSVQNVSYCSLQTPRRLHDRSSCALSLLALMMPPPCFCFEFLCLPQIFFSRLSPPALSTSSPCSHAYGSHLCRPRGCGRCIHRPWCHEGPRGRLAGPGNGQVCQGISCCLLQVPQHENHREQAILSLCVHRCACLTLLSPSLSSDLPGVALEEER